jgi:hypothetical protein
MSRLHILVRTFLERPDLAGRVRHLTMAYSSPKLDSDGPLEQLEEIYADMRVYLRHLLHNEDLNDDELYDDEFYYIEHYDRGRRSRDLENCLFRIATEDIALFCLLGLCQEITTLELEVWDFCNSGTWSHLRKSFERQHFRHSNSVSQSMQYLPRLRSLTLRIHPSFEADDYCDHDSIPDLAAFLLLPSLKELHCDHIDFFYRNPEPSSLGVGSDESFSDRLLDHSQYHVQEL